MTIEPSDLACQADIARRAGVTRHVVRYWAEADPRFPAPFTRLGDNGGIPVWDYREVEAYLRRARIA